MPIRWRRLKARTGDDLYERVDPIPLEAAGPAVKRTPVRTMLAHYIRDLRSPVYVSDEVEGIRDQLADFFEEDEEDQVLSDYQIELLARELGSELPDIVEHEPVPDPGPAGEVELGDPPTVPVS